MTVKIKADDNVTSIFERKRLDNDYWFEDPKRGCNGRGYESDDMAKDVMELWGKRFLADYLPTFRHSLGYRDGMDYDDWFENFWNGEFKENRVNGWRGCDQLDWEKQEWKRGIAGLLGLLCGDEFDIDRWIAIFSERWVAAEAFGNWVVQTRAMSPQAMRPLAKDRNFTL